MFHNLPVDKTLTPEPSTKPTLHSSDTITCLGSINVGVCKKSQTTDYLEKIQIVDVEGPDILGLPSPKRLQVVDLNLDALPWT